MNLMLVTRAAACGLLILSSHALQAQSLAFNTLAGYAGHGSADGTGNRSAFNNPGSVALDGAGNLYVADADNHTIRMITPAGVASTLAGFPGISGSADGVGSSARFNQPLGVAVDTSGNVYVADSANHTIRKMTAVGATWSVSTLAGLPGVSGSTDGTGGGALFYEPEGVAVDTAGNLYVADTWNHTIRKITTSGSVSTLAGSAGNYGTADGVGSSARFYQPQGVAVDSSGVVYVADTANQTIRKVTSGGSVTTLAGSPGNYGSADGTGTSARFYQPAAVAVDGSGNLYVADYFNSTVRMVTSLGAVSTLAGSPGIFGSADGMNSVARFRGPQGIAVTATGNLTLYVADSGNGTIRSLAQTGSNWLVGTWAGSPSAGSADDPGGNARFYGPEAVALSGSGAAYVADSENNTIREIAPGGPVSTFAGVAGISGSSDGVGANARFYGPQGIAFDSAGNLYVADSANATIRKISPSGFVSTLAGSAGHYGPDDGAGSSARFYQPTGIAVDSMGHVYVSDSGNQTIRKITPDGVVSTLAGLVGNAGSADGTNTDARFNGPAGIGVDSAGNLYVSDFYNHAIRKVTPGGSVTTIAGLGGVWGNADGMNNAARFFEPAGVTVDGAGNVYVADSGNYTVRKLALSGTNWVVTTVAGLAGVSGSTGGLASDARFTYPMGLAANSAGLLCVADTGNNTICLGAFVPGAAPTILAQPQSQSVNAGSSVTFTVPTAGSLPLSYQWRLNSAPIPGATDSTYTRTNVQTGDLGSYSAVVTNGLGNVTSSNALLTLSVPPLITTQPQSQSVLAGQTASFFVIASGMPTPHYQWRYNDADIPGANTSTFSIGSVSPTNGGYYSVVVSNSAGLELSSEALLIVTALLGSGDNSLGQLNVPPEATNVVTIAAGGWHNLALRSDGTVVAWGDDSAGQSDVPPTLTGVLAIAAGGYHSLAIKSDLTLAAWGADDSGQTNIPNGLANVIAVSAGTWHTLALRRDGTVAAWGDNSWGQTNVPSGLSNAVAVAAGGNHSLALKADGTVAAWGDNNDSQGIFVGQSVVPMGLTNVIGVAAGDYHSLALRADGTVVAWGDNSQGQCNVPAGLSNVVALAGGGAHTLALEADGSMAAWGANWNGQCDIAATSTDVAALAAGESHSLVLSGGTLPVPLLLNPAVRNHEFSALAQTLSRKHYALEFNTSITSTDWTGPSTNAGNGFLEQLTDPAPPTAQRFYRVRQW
jgi:sugar lactone lactonase YvrE